MCLYVVISDQSYVLYVFLFLVPSTSRVLNKWLLMIDRPQGGVAHAPGKARPVSCMLGKRKASQNLYLISLLTQLCSQPSCFQFLPPTS